MALKVTHTPAGTKLSKVEYEAATSHAITGAAAPQAHKDSHDPNDGSDALDTAAPVKVGSANAIGDSHSLARANHVHNREHAKYTDSNVRSAAVSDTAYAASWDGVTTIAPSKNAVYDKIETLGVGAATKEFYSSVTLAYDGGSFGIYLRWVVAILNASGDTAAITFHMPSDFSSITDAVAIVIPRATQANANYDLYSYYATTGEVHNVNAETDTVSTYNVTNNQLFEIDISGVLSSVAADDYVAILVREATTGHDLNVIGVRIKYS